ncbi:zinc finger, CCHC-type containing protein, partial [Tanacetum coccineum]
GQQVAPEALAAHAAWVKGSKEIVVLMLITMESDIQQNLENLGAYEMLQELKTLFAQQTEQELLQTMREFHSCKHEEGQSYVLKMKSYIDNLERLGHPVSLGLGYLAELLKNKKLSQGGSGSGIFTIELYTFHNKSWVYDTGCGTLICNTTQGLRGSRKLKLCCISLYVGNGQRAAVEAIGSYHLSLPSGLVIVLNNYHYTRSITRGVISVSCLYDDGYVNRFVDNSIQVSRNNMVYFSVAPRDGIFEIDLSNSYTNVSSIYALSNKRAKSNLESALLLHCRLGHISKKLIEKLQHDGLLNSTDLMDFEKCVPDEGEQGEVNGNGGNGNGGNGNGNGNGGEYGYKFKGFMPARECTYRDFLKCQPLNFNGTERVVRLTRWFEKMETIFHISNCPKKYQVKYASCTLLNSALTWWNSHKRTIGIEAAYAMSWAELMKLMTERIVLSRMYLERLNWVDVESSEQSRSRGTDLEMDVDVEGSDEPYSEPEIDPVEAVIEACFDFADIIRASGVKLGYYRALPHEGAIEGTYETLGDLVQRFHDHTVAIPLKWDNRRLRDIMDVESQRVTRFWCRELRVQRELRQIWRFRFYDRLRISRLEACAKRHLGYRS